MAVNNDGPEESAGDVSGVHCSLISKNPVSPVLLMMGLPSSIDNAPTNLSNGTLDPDMSPILHWKAPGSSGDGSEAPGLGGSGADTARSFDPFFPVANS